MELPKIKKSEHGGGMLDGIKSKLGFADANSRGYDDGYYDDYSEPSDEFGEYGDDFGEFSEYGPGYDDRGSSSPRYEPYTPPVTTRPARSSRAASRTEPGMPKLVSIDDVRAHTQVPDSLNRDPLPPRRVSSASSAYRGERTVVDVTQPAPSSPAHTAAQRERSEGLNSLFAPTTETPVPAAGARAASATVATATANPVSAPSASPSAATAASAGAAASAYDPYDAYAGSGAAAHSPSRSLSVLKPASYGEVEYVARQLKAGDAVILALRNTPDNLAKRILDFSFGVSSALDARVECVSDKVFAITRGAELTEAERIALRNQGVL